jgi:hypothetical protein
MQNDRKKMVAIVIILKVIPKIDENNAVSHAKDCCSSGIAPTNILITIIERQTLATK